MEKRSRWIVLINTGAANSQRYYTSPGQSAITSTDKGGNMIGKIIEEEKYYAGIDRVILQGKEKRKSVDLSNVNGIVKVSHFQKSKY